jgi:coenzyme F420 hydrogenase subunit beta
MSASIAERLERITHAGLCTGCTTCVGVCPDRALQMHTTLTGQHIPQLVDSGCRECGLCMAVCPTDNENFQQLNQFVFGRIPGDLFIGNFLRCYTGYSTDRAVRWSGTSGGLTTSLLLYLLRSGLIDGALLTKASADNPLGAEPFVARTEEDVLSAMGSRYVPVPLNQLLRHALYESGRFAVVGLPCHMQGVRRAELKLRTLRDRIVYHFGLTCSHVVNLRGVEYVLHHMGIPVDDVVRMKYRGDGWPGGLQVWLKGGEQRFLPIQSSVWSDVFGGYFFTPFCCTVCHDHLNELADVSFADAWLPEIIESDAIGTSVMVTRTRVGEELVRAAVSDDVIEVFAVADKDVIRSQRWPLLFKKRNIAARVAFLSALGRELPKTVLENRHRFVRPTLCDYAAALMVYISMFISNTPLASILRRLSPRVLTAYKRQMRRCLLRNSGRAFADSVEAKKTETIRILVTNSHSNNRGDEAAQRNMVSSLRSLLSPVEFTVLTASPEGLQMPEGVQVLPFFGLKQSALLVALWLAGKRLGIRVPRFGKRQLFEALERMANADIVLSAPGGPYFGDLYTPHEVQHLFHIWLAEILSRPVMIYGPSAGPFKSWWLNPLRRAVLNRAEIITVRDEISYEYLQHLKLTHPLVYLAADSAFQESADLGAEELERIMSEEGIVVHRDRGAGQGLLVGMTPVGAEWNYPDASNPDQEQQAYNQILAGTVDYLVETYQATVVFFPHLYGKHSDMPLIESIIGLVHNKEAVRVISHGRDSRVQEALTARMDIFVGNRYHSVVFALKREVPVVCLAYQHKSIGLMKSVGLERYVIKISDLTTELLYTKIDRLLCEKEDVVAALHLQVGAIKERASLNSILAADLVTRTVNERDGGLHD